jgi:hypothetical protein
MDKGSLYGIALQCAKLNDAGCALGCEQCQFNIFNYGLEINEAALLKANAYTDYCNQKAMQLQRVKEIKDYRDEGIIARLIVVGLIVVAFLWCCNSIKSCGGKKIEQVREYDVSGPPGDLLDDDKEFWQLVDRPNDPSMIPTVLRIMKRYGVPDMNKDGKVDCIDYSIYFRMLYGSNAFIIMNKNPKTGMNHMFIQVHTSLSFYDIEPQGTEYVYAMSAIWGMKYDPFYNQDVTSQWGGYVRGR